jgi:acyl carrier protein
MSVRDAILSTFRQVADAQGRTLAPLSDNLKLAECGLDSLGFAVVITSLEDSLDAGPFNSSAWEEFPVTLGDFIKLYERAVD